MKAPELFIFFDIPKMPFGLDGTDLTVQDSFFTLDIMEYDNVFLDTEYDEKFFMQTLQICEIDEDREEAEV